MRAVTTQAKWGAKATLTCSPESCLAYADTNFGFTWATVPRSNFVSELNAEPWNPFVLLTFVIL